MSFIDKIKAYIDPGKYGDQWSDMPERTDNIPQHIDVTPIPRENNQEIRNQTDKDITKEAKQQREQAYWNKQNHLQNPNGPYIKLINFNPNQYNFPKYLGISPIPKITNKLRFLYKDKIDPMSNQIYNITQGRDRLRIKYYMNKIDHQDIPLVKPIAPDTPKDIIQQHLANPESTKTWNSPLNGRTSCGVTAYYDADNDPHGELTKIGLDQLMETTATNHRIGCAYMLGINYDNAIKKDAIDVITGLPIPAKDLHEFVENYQHSTTKYEDCHNLFEKQLITIKCAPQSIQKELSLLVLKGDNDPSSRIKDVKTNEKHFSTRGYLNPFEVAYQFKDPKDFWHEMYNSINTRKIAKQLNGQVYDKSTQIELDPIERPEMMYQDYAHNTGSLTDNDKQMYTQKYFDAMTNLSVDLDTQRQPIYDDIDKIFDANISAREVQDNKPYDDLWQMYNGDFQTLLEMKNSDRIANFDHIMPDNKSKVHYSYDPNYPGRFFNDHPTDIVQLGNSTKKAPFANAIRNDVLHRLKTNGLAKTWQQDKQNYPNLLNDRHIPYQLKHPSWQKYPDYANPSYVEEIINLTYMSVINQLPNLGRRSEIDKQAYREIVQSPLISDRQSGLKYKHWVNHDLHTRLPYIENHDPYFKNTTHPYPYHNINEKNLTDTPWDPTIMMPTESQRQYAIKQQETMAQYENPYKTIRQQQQDLNDINQKYNETRENLNNMRDAYDYAQAENESLRNDMKQQQTEYNDRLQEAYNHNDELQNQFEEEAQYNANMYNAYQNLKQNYKQQTNNLNKKIEDLNQKNKDLKIDRDYEHRRAVGQRNAGYQQGYNAGLHR